MLIESILSACNLQTTISWNSSLAALCQEAAGILPHFSLQSHHFRSLAIKMLPRSTWILTRLYSMAQEGVTSTGEAMRAITTSATSLRLLRDPQPPQPPPGSEK
jgi:hypothetical protein